MPCPRYHLRVGRPLVPLAAQADAAKKYLALKEELTEIDVNLTVTEIQEAKAIWETKRKN